VESNAQSFLKSIPDVKIFSRRVFFVAGALLMAAGCQDVPKYKKSSGKFNEWGSYEKAYYEPSAGKVTAIDAAAGTITISRGKDNRVLPVTAETRIMHEGTDITLAELPLNQEVKYTLSPDRKRLMTVWYGVHLLQVHPPTAAATPKTTFF